MRSLTIGGECLEAKCKRAPKPVHSVCGPRFLERRKPSTDLPTLMFRAIGIRGMEIAGIGRHLYIALVGVIHERTRKICR